MAETQPKLSLAMIAKNEARCIGRCLASIRLGVDEIVVVDTGSTDETTSVAREFGARIFYFPWNNNFSAARNFALEQTTGAWILVLDADEYASDKLTAEIRNFTKGRQTVGRLKIVSEFRRRNQTLRSQDFVSRLFPRGAHFEGRIHEQLVSPLPCVNLQEDLFHDGYLEVIKSNRNVKLLLQELEQRPGNPYLLFQLALEYTSQDSPAKACDCLQKAFDSITLKEPFAPNVVVDYLYALMELQSFEKGLSVIQKSANAVADFPDFHLVCGLFYMNLVRSNSAKYISYLPRIECSFKQALALGESDKYKSVRGAGTFLAQYNLGTLYQVFGDPTAARRCFEQAAAFEYQPAKEMLARL